MDETVSLPTFLFPHEDESISWPREGGRLTRGLFTEVAEEEEGSVDRVGRTVTRKGGVYLRGILMRGGCGAAV